MAGHGHKKKVLHGNTARSDINVTPLIDIVLVLLIIFIVMVPGLSKAAKIVVPQIVKTDTPPPPNQKDDRIVISILENNDVMLQSDKMDLKDLAPALTKVVQLQPMNMRKVFIKVDEEVKYQRAVDVLDQVRRASDQAKRETAAKPEWLGQDGGDVKVVASVNKKKT
ncbi:MAG: biopolymer transporter ExbD [Acidobacteria bacterium]|nr:biopolymer transporter ExbD [Acidobacteriota bacterium]